MSCRSRDTMCSSSGAKDVSVIFVSLRICVSVGGLIGQGKERELLVIHQEQTP